MVELVGTLGLNHFYTTYTEIEAMIHKITCLRQVYGRSTCQNIFSKTYSLESTFFYIKFILKLNIMSFWKCIKRCCVLWNAIYFLKCSQEMSYQQTESYSPQDGTLSFLKSSMFSYGRNKNTNYTLLYLRAMIGWW